MFQKQKHFPTISNWIINTEQQQWLKKKKKGTAQTHSRTQSETFVNISVAVTDKWRHFHNLLCRHVDLPDHLQSAETLVQT